jgi:hypothetical protein
LEKYLLPVVKKGPLTSGGEFVNSVGQIVNQKEVVKMLAVELTDFTRQRCKFEQKINTLKESNQKEM